MRDGPVLAICPDNGVAHCSGAAFRKYIMATGVGKYCTALDFLDTVIAIVDPTGGSRRWAIAVPEPTAGVVF